MGRFRVWLRDSEAQFQSVPTYPGTLTRSKAGSLQDPLARVLCREFGNPLWNELADLFSRYNLACVSRSDSTLYRGSRLSIHYDFFSCRLLEPQVNHAFTLQEMNTGCNGTSTEQISLSEQTLGVEAALD